MNDQYPAPEEDPAKVHEDAGAGRSEAWHDAPPPEAVSPAVAVDEGVAALSTVATPVSADAPYVPVDRNQLPPQLYAHKSEVLYAFGGVFFPGVVFLLMGGKKSTGIIMLCCFVVSVALSIVFIGIPLLLATYIWSVIACFREARRQNEAHGFVS